ncbi:hypothetical protein D3C78_1547340 [compost metagenome]
MGRLVEVVRGLDGQAAAFAQLPGQMRIQQRVIGQPLQRSVGQDHIHALRGCPGADFTQLELNALQPLAGGSEHVPGAVQPRDGRLGVTLGQHLGRIARATTKVDGGANGPLRQCCHQVAHRPGAFVLEGAVLRG